MNVQITNLYQNPEDNAEVVIARKGRKLVWCLYILCNFFKTIPVLTLKKEKISNYWTKFPSSIESATEFRFVSTRS